MAGPSSTSVPRAGADLAAGRPTGPTCSQLNRDAPGWSLAESCRDREQVEGSSGGRGDGESTGKVRVTVKAWRKERRCWM